MTLSIIVYSPSLHPVFQNFDKEEKLFPLCLLEDVECIDLLALHPVHFINEKFCDVLLTFKWMNRRRLWIESNVESYRFGWRDGSGRKGQEKREDVGGTWKRRIKGIRRNACFRSELSRRDFSKRGFLNDEAELGLWSWNQFSFKGKLHPRWFFIAPRLEFPILKFDFFNYYEENKIPAYCKMFFRL